jgi:uncharacterized protein (TIGR02284 family)
MAKTNEEVISVLNNLIETLKDGQEGFRTAAEGISHSELKTVFNSYSQQRAQFAAELQNEVRRLGGDPEKTGSIAATLHRGWMDIKSVVTGGDDAAIVVEAERGEDSAVATYREALNEDLPADVRAIVETQDRAIKETHDRIRTFELASGASG